MNNSSLCFNNHWLCELSAGVGALHLKFAVNNSSLCFPLQVMSKLQDVRARLSDYREKKRALENKGGRNIQSSEGNSASTNEFEKKDETIDDSKARETELIYEDPRFYWLKKILKALVWLLLWGFFISFEFGLVYFVCSCLFFIILSMRGGKKRKPGTLSAYSVFNKNFETIDGTLTAEQFERELRHGPSSVK